MLKPSCAAVLLLAASGCGEREPAMDASVKLLDPMAVSDHVVIVDTGRAQARLLDVSGGAPPAPVVIPLVKNPTKAELRKGHADELLVLCAGQPDTSRDVTPERPGLIKIDSNGRSTAYRYDSPFDRMVQSDDGKYAFLFFGPGTDDGTTLRNPNEVAFVDLDSDDEKPALKTLRSLGESPQDVKFSGPMSINGAERNLAVVLLQRNIAVVDLSHFDRSEFTVELAKPGAAGLNAAQVYFSTQDVDPKIYLRAEGSDDVFVISIESAVAPASPDGGGPAGDNDFSLNFSQLGTGPGAGPSDIRPFVDNGKTRLLVAAPGKNTAVVIDADSGRTTTIALPMKASQILLYEGPKPSSSEVAQRALLYSPGSSTVAFMDLVELGSESNRSGNVEVLQVPQAYAKVTPLGDGPSVDQVMLLHQGTGLSLLNLGDRSISPITGPNVIDAIPDLDVGKLWLTPPGDRLGFLTLTDYHPNEVRLDAVIDRFVSVPSAHERKVAVTHPGAMGYMTVLDARTPADLGKAFAVSGYLFEGVLGGANR
jgi:hypothetical protein